MRLIILRQNFLAKEEYTRKAYQDILKQKEKGVIILPLGYSLEYCDDDDVEIKLEKNGVEWHSHNML